MESTGCLDLKWCFYELLNIRVPKLTNLLSLEYTLLMESTVFKMQRIQMEKSKEIKSGKKHQIKSIKNLARATASLAENRNRSMEGATTVYPTCYCAFLEFIMLHITTLAPNKTSNYTFSFGTGWLLGARRPRTKSTTGGNLSSNERGSLLSL